MARAILSLSSTPATRCLNLPSPSSFKGNTAFLRPAPRRIPAIKLSGVGIVAAATPTTIPGSESVRYRLNNLGPQKGSRKKGKRKGRGIAAGQGNSCGFGMRGQKSRSGPGVRRGFEGGQMPLYRRLPKLRGIAGGNRFLCSASPLSVCVNASMSFIKLAHFF